MQESNMTPNELLRINVNDHVEKKNNLSYLSWAWAWAEVLKVDHKATFEVKTFVSGNTGNVICYMDINGTAMVWVTVTIFGKPMTCQLPVMDYRNKPIHNPDAFAVNTAIMRCLAKAVALHGLGLYIYAGEDLPEEDKAAVAPAVKLQQEDMTPPAQPDANKQLFAEGMIRFTKICKDLPGLNSYWKANQAQLDDLKKTHPDLYQGVRDAFTELKAQFKTGETQ
jgi:hypothetical protein